MMSGSLGIGRDLKVEFSMDVVDICGTVDTDVGTIDDPNIGDVDDDIIGSVSMDIGIVVTGTMVVMRNNREKKNKIVTGLFIVDIYSSSLFYIYLVYVDLDLYIFSEIYYR